MAKARKRPRGTTIREILRETNEIENGGNLLGNSTLPIHSQPETTQAGSYAHPLYHRLSDTQPRVHSQNISGTGPKTNKAPKKNKGRGPAKLPDEWDTDTKIQVTLNEDGQLVGVKEQYNKFISALGAISRIGTYLPLDYARWSDMPQEKLDNVWREVESNTSLPPEAKKIVLQTINGMWKDWKARVKAKYFTPYEQDPEHDFSLLPNDLANDQVDMDQLSNLVSYWRVPTVQMQCEGKPTTKLDVLIESRTCGKGLDAYPETAKLVEGINEALANVPESERTEEFKDELFTNALGEDPQGRVRCMGRGITPSKFRRVYASYVVQPEHTKEFWQLKEDLEREKLKNEQMKLEVEHLRNELEKVTEQVIKEVREEFRHEMNHMKLSLDFFEALVDPSTLRASLSQVTSFGAQLSANKIRPPHAEQQSHQVSKTSNSQSGAEQCVNNDLPLHNPIKTNILAESRTTPPVQFVATRMEDNYDPFDDTVTVGSSVVLLCSEIPKQVVAEGVILSMDPKQEIDKVLLGPGFVKVAIKKATKPSYLLNRPLKGVKTVGQAFGKFVAWELVNVMRK